MTIENIDEHEMAAAAKLSAACEHSANEHGVCVYCGALQPSDAAKSWEPPVRRSLLFPLRACTRYRVGEAVGGGFGTMLAVLDDQSREAVALTWRRDATEKIVEALNAADARRRAVRKGSSRS